MFEKEDFKKTTPQEPELLDISSTDSVEDLTRELVEHQDRLLALKRQQEEVEVRKRELEELSQRRAELAAGQKSMREKLTRAVNLLERAEYDTQREIETIHNTRSNFKEHLESIEKINPKDWEPEEVDEQLTLCLSIIDHAQASYNQSRVKLESISGRLGHYEQIDDDDEGELIDSDHPPFLELVRRGFAFSLPLMILLSAIAFLLLIRNS
ncbi:MAG: hypothetical protein AAF558_12120 [Verrucomicrobiota bacterium]